jgi:hypothetical protein
MKYLRILVVVVSLGMLVPGAGFSASKKPKATPAPIIQSPTIAAVTADSITIKEGQTTKTLGITQFTETTVNGRKATAAELKPGMTVNVTLGTDPTKAARINATAK